MDVYSQILLTSALAGGGWSALSSCPVSPGTHWTGGWVGDVEKRKFLTIPGLEIRPLDRPTRSQSLYRLRYPGSSSSSSREKNVWNSDGSIQLHVMNICEEWKEIVVKLSTRRRRMVSFTPRPLYPRGKSPCAHWIRGK
jgi:hypothetical protein